MNLHEDKTNRWYPVFLNLEETLKELIRSDNHIGVQCIFTDLMDNFSVHSFAISSTLAGLFQYCVMMMSDKCLTYILNTFKYSPFSISQTNLALASINVILKPSHYTKKIKMLQELVQNGCALNFIQSNAIYDYTLIVETNFVCPLHAAIYMKQANVVRWLVENGAKIHIEDMEYALEKKNQKIIEILITFLSIEMTYLYMMLINRFDSLNYIQQVWDKIDEAVGPKSLLEPISCFLGYSIENKRIKILSNMPDHNNLIEHLQFLLREGLKLLVDKSIERPTKHRIQHVLIPGVEWYQQKGIELDSDCKQKYESLLTLL
jgi:hypothetical protein